MSDSKASGMNLAALAIHERPEPRRLQVLTLGNRSAYEIGRRLAIGWEHRHIWHATWPSLGGDPMPLGSELDSPVFDRIRSAARREWDKSIVNEIGGAHWDVAIMSTAVHAGTSFAIDGAKCIPDFTVAPWLTDLDWGEGRQPSIWDLVGPDATHITWRDPDFIGLAKAGFDRAYERIFRRRIKAGGRVFVYRQTPAGWSITAKGLERFDSPDSALIEAMSNALADHAAGFKGVTVIEALKALDFTSDDSAEGLGALSPIDEQYVHLASAIALAMGDRLAGDVVARYMVETRRERVALTPAPAANTDRERDLEAVVRSLVDRAAGLEKEVLAMKRTLSWRITQPLRAVRGLRHRPSRP